MTIMHQGLYYIEKVHQNNRNLADFPSDLINDGNGTQFAVPTS